MTNRTLIQRIILSLDPNAKCTNINNKLNEVYFLLHDIQNTDASFYKSIFEDWSVLEEYNSLTISNGNEYLEEEYKDDFTYRLQRLQKRVTG